MALGKHTNRLRGIPGVVAEIATEVIARSAGQNPQHDVLAAAGNQPVRHIAPRPVAPDRDDDILAVVHGTLGEIALLTGTGGRTVRDVAQGLVEQGTIGVDPLASAPPAGRGIEDDEEPPSGQKSTILSKVCRPCPYHSSRNG